ncbi:hypothetical protein RvY_10058 [Ramazzottius varieornatus]|uniref:Protein kinase domain-containing protein n=1 Tax=Ramazzottius varieornatus TaxID=947166 RepID=A0A1D1VDY0_RAMVA|nr:hypothetical protein RvY_10058 [Ramazzottius varieornatus]
MGNQRSTLQKGHAEAAPRTGYASKRNAFDRLWNGGPCRTHKKFFPQLPKLRSPEFYPFRNSKRLADSLASSSCRSVTLLRVTPIIEDSFRDGRTTEEQDDSDYGSGSASTASTCSSGRSMASFKRSERGRSPCRWSNFHSSDGEDSGNDSSGAQLYVPSLKNSSETPWPITVKDSLFYPQFPRRTRHREEPRFETWLSKGCFSSVSRVLFLGDGQRYALKQISKSVLMHNTGLIEQVKQEVHIQKECCHHPFLLGAVDSWQTRTHVCILAPFVKGGDLDKLAHRCGSFPEQVVQVWAAEIGMALDHLHKCGALHRDLKLANVLVDSNGHLKLADFGLAKLVSCNRARTICGTLEYMAPEVMNGGGYGVTADWWSYGILLYRLLMGRYPLEAEEDHFQMSKKVAQHCYIGWEECESLQRSPSAVSLLGQLLKKDPDRRLKDFDAIKRERFFNEVQFVDVLRKKVSPFSLFGSWPSPALRTSDALFGGFSSFESSC